jgi:hypothetical protein
MNHKSAINWDYLSQARRLQEKLHQYFGLVEQVRAMEEDPELQAALAALGGGPGSPDVAPPAPPVSTIRTASMVPEKQRRRGEGDRLLSLARDGEAFDAHTLLARVKTEAPELEAMTAKQANDHLRRYAGPGGKIRLVKPGKRGQTGSMPVYELVTEGTSAAKTAFELPREIVDLGKLIKGLDKEP